MRYIIDNIHGNQTEKSRPATPTAFPHAAHPYGVTEENRIIPAIVGPAIVKADCIRFKAHPSLAAAYLNAALNCQPTRHRIKDVIHGIGRPRLSLGEIRTIALPIPPEDEQHRIVAEVDRRLSIVREVEAEVDANLNARAGLAACGATRAFADSNEPGQYRSKEASYGQRNHIELASLRFDGKRFEGHALDVECTQELIAYRSLILECAKELWRRKNPGRVRLPRGFEDGFRVQFDRIDEGSAVVPLRRVREALRRS